MDDIGAKARMFAKKIAEKSLTGNGIRTELEHVAAMAYLEGFEDAMKEASLTVLKGRRRND